MLKKFLFCLCLVFLPAPLPAMDIDAPDDDHGYLMRRRDRITKIVEKMEAAKAKARMPVSQMPNIWPVHGVVTSLYGPRKSPFTGKRRFHTGIDIGAPTGTPVRAPAGGLVIFAGPDGSYGNAVEIHHGKGVVTRYAHLSRVIAKKGEVLKRGETLGLVGSTGRSTGPHLHYEVILSGQHTNPFRHVLVNDRRYLAGN